MNEALLLVGHGSRDPHGVAEFLALGRAVAARRPGQMTGVAFLEFAQPTIDEAIEQLVAAGAESLVCQPAMLFAAGHVQSDVPGEVRAAMRRWPGVALHVGRALGPHPRLLELCRVRWDEALRTRPPCPASDTALLLVGRGTSDTDANAHVAEAARLLGEDHDVARADACYSGVTAPLFAEALEVAGQSGCSRIVVQPYFLFTGVLVKKIHQRAQECARRRSELDVVVTSHLGVHPLLVDVFEERAREASLGVLTLE
jgi:sirohydrochlorin ferrochelatase